MFIVFFFNIPKRKLVLINYHGIVKAVIILMIMTVLVSLIL